MRSQNLHFCKGLRVSRQSNASTVALGEADHERPDPRRFHEKVPCFVGTKTL